MFGSILDSVFGSQYTIGDLMNIDQGRQMRASNCEVNLIETYHELKKEGLLDKFKSLFSKPVVTMYYVIFKLEVISDTGNKHIVIIRTSPDFNLQDWGNNKIKIYCNCADFKYRSAFNLNKRSSLFVNDKVKISLGEALTTPPKRIATTMLCKHAFAALNWLVNNYQSVMRTI